MQLKILRIKVFQNEKYNRQGMSLQQGACLGKQDTIFYFRIVF